MPSSEPTCWPRGLLGILDYAIAAGAPAATLERRAGFTRAQLRIRERRIPLTAYYDGVEAAAELLGAPHFGLDFIDAVEPAQIEAVGFLAAAAPTVGDAFARILTYHRYMTSAEIFEMTLSGGLATFTFSPWGPQRPAHAHVTEMYLADCVLLVARMTGEPVALHALSLPHAPACPEAFERRVGRLPERGEARWSIGAEVLKRPMPRPDPGLSTFLEDLLRPKAAPYLERPLVARVTAAVQSRLPSGAPTLPEVARTLGLSARTLQRRLAGEGTSFEALVEATRRTVARACREAGLTEAETALRCGYADPSSFHRAKRRWAE